MIVPRIKVVMRWLGVLPGSIAAAWGAWIAVNWGVRLSMQSAGIDSEWIFTRLGIEWVSNYAMGVALILGGAKIAPTHRKLTAYWLAAFGVLAAGAMLYANVLRSEGWGSLGSLALAAGSAVTAYRVSEGEVDVANLFSRPPAPRT